MHPKPWRPLSKGDYKDNYVHCGQNGAKDVNAVGHYAHVVDDHCKVIFVNCGPGLRVNRVTTHLCQVGKGWEFGYHFCVVTQVVDAIRELRCLYRGLSKANGHAARGLVCPVRFCISERRLPVSFCQVVVSQEGSFVFLPIAPYRYGRGRRREA